MSSINSNPRVSAAFDQVRRFVQIKRTWAEDWTLAWYLEPLRVRDAVAPEVPVADFRYAFGEIKREDRTAFTADRPLDLRGWYIRVLIQAPGNSPQPIWTGVVADDQTNYDRDEVLSGNQGIRAYGLAHLLDRVIIDKAHVFENEQVRQIDWCPTFNVPHHRGRSPDGNAYIVGDEDFVFGSVGERQKWSNRMIAVYLLKRFAPDFVTWTLTGRFAPLSRLYEIVDLDGMSIWQAINRLIDRRRGLGFSVKVVEDTVYLEVFTTTHEEIKFGETTLPANPWPVNFTMPTDHPFTHLVDDIGFKSSTINQYDEIIVQGKNILLCATFDYVDIENLEPGWTETLAADYREAVSPTDSEKNDKYRTHDDFDGVFCKHRVPKDWDWRVSRASGGSASVAPTPRDDGTFDFEEETSGFWNRQKVFERDLPFEVGKDYTQTQIEDKNPPNTEPEYVPLMVLYRDVSGLGTHTVDNLWHHVDKLHEDFPDIGFPTVNVRPLDKEMGFELGVTPRHFFAHPNWEGAAPAKVKAELNYHNLIVTAAWRGDVRQRVVKRKRTVAQSEEQPDYLRRLVITVASAEYWYADPATVVGIDSSGQLKRINADLTAIRDDKSKLEAVAVFADAWYGVHRQAVTIPIKLPGVFCPLGAMLTDIVMIQAREPVRTVVTSRDIDFQAETTLIETGWGSIDQAPEPLV